MSGTTQGLSLNSSNPVFNTRAQKPGLRKECPVSDAVSSGKPVGLQHKNAVLAPQPVPNSDEMGLEIPKDCRASVPEKTRETVANRGFVFRTVKH